MSQEIVPSPIPPDIVLYLINAIYFKGEWAQQFDESLTRGAPFYLSDGTSTNVQMMSTGRSAETRVGRTLAPLYRPTVYSAR